MKYKVNWIERNLGVTRKALRIYEDKGLIDKTTIQNPDNKYREYSNEDIERIWCYKLLQGVGYTLSEIVEMTNTADFDYQLSLRDKIIELEKKKTEIDNYIGFAKALRLTGSFPLPMEIGSIRFDDFIKSVLECWNVNNNLHMSKMYNLAEIILNKSESEFSEADIEYMENAVNDSDVKDLFFVHTCLSNLAERKELSSSDPIVQVFVNIIYEQYCERLLPEEVAESMTPQKFVGSMVRLFTVGHSAEIQEKNFGKDGCDFIVESFLHFGGFSDIKDIGLTSNYYGNGDE